MGFRKAQASAGKNPMWLTGWTVQFRYRLRVVERPPGFPDLNGVGRSENWKPVRQYFSIKDHRARRPAESERHWHVRKMDFYYYRLSCGSSRRRDAMSAGRGFSAESIAIASLSANSTSMEKVREQ